MLQSLVNRCAPCGGTSAANQRTLMNTLRHSAGVLLPLALLLHACPPAMPTNPSPDGAAGDAANNNASDSGPSPADAGAMTEGTTCAELGRACVLDRDLALTPLALSYDSEGAPVVAYVLSGEYASARWSGSQWQAVALPERIAFGASSSHSELHRVGATLYLVLSAAADVRVFRLFGTSWQETEGSPIRMPAASIALDPRFVQFVAAASNDRLYVASEVLVEGAARPIAVRSFDGSAWTLLTLETGIANAGSTAMQLCVRADNQGVALLYGQHQHFAWSNDPEPNSWAWTRGGTFAASMGCIDDGAQTYSVESTGANELRLLRRTNGDFAALGMPIANAMEHGGSALLLRDARNAPIVAYLGRQGELDGPVFHRWTGEAWQRFAPIAARPRTMRQRQFAAARNGNALGVLWTQQNSGGLDYLRYDEVALP